ncbi:MAG: methionyl-tRNA formyltransferase, partial [Acidobacteria bacterium]|nr:methionyl-tRNA formyltransferase [Acidobacteriota bacterium]
GAAPIQWAVVRGESKTGVTTMQMDPGLDTGPVLLQWETGIGAEETSVSLGKRLSVAGADLMIETLKGLEKGTLIARPQDNSLASRAPLLKKDDGRIDWSLSAQEIFNRVRGLLPWPGAHTVFRGKKLQVWRAKPNPAESADSAVSCGQLLAEQDRVSVACGGGTSLQLLELQMEGKRRVVAADFIHGARPQAGELLFS